MVDVHSVVTENIDVWTGAIKKRNATGRGSHKKIELTGIKKLRQLILELAVSGRILPQDPNDEPASTLLKKIRIERERLLREKKLKPQKKAVHYEEPIKFEVLPNGWSSACFGDITFNRDAERIPLSVKDRRTRQGEIDYYGASGVIDSIDDFLFDKPLLLIGEDGANLVNRSTPIAFMAYGRYWVNNHAHVIDGITDEFLCYLGLYINSISLIPYITGMAQPKMNQAKMNSILVAVPPENEQIRIMTKVDELMALCDQLEQQTEDSITAHKTLVETLLGALTNSTNAKEFNESWKRIAQHFDILFTTENSIDQLKQTILQLAVMGKLVPQDPNDEPASVLLEKIAKEKERLIAEKKIKKQKALPEIREDEKPFELPVGWEWIYSQDIFCFENGDRSSRYPNKSDLVSNGIPFFGAPDIKFGKLNYGAELRFITSDKFKELSNGKLVDRDFVMLLRGSVGKVAQFRANNEHNTGFINAQMLILRLINTSLDKYLYRYFSSLYFKKDIADKKSGAVIQQIPASKISEMKVPLPPLSEQYRITIKVDELMTLCEQLKAQLGDAQTTQLYLADAIVERAVG